MGAFRRTFERLYRSMGKDTDIDAEIPVSLLGVILLRRGVWLARGLARRRALVFIGPRVRIRGGRKLRMGRAATIEGGCRVDAMARNGVSLGARSKLGEGTIVSCTSHLSRFGEGLAIGDDVGVGEWCYFGASGGITIGDDVIMGQFVGFHAQHHEYELDDGPIRALATSERGIVIEQGCWIGTKATFLDGARVGAGSVVAAGAVVRGEFGPGSVLGGTPARLLKAREPHS